VNSPAAIGVLSLIAAGSVPAAVAVEVAFARLTRDPRHRACKRAYDLHVRKASANVVPMNTTPAAATVTLPAPIAGRVAVIVDGEQVGTVKDGGHLVRNVDALLRRNGVLRTGAWELTHTPERVFTFTAARLGA